MEPAETEGALADPVDFILQIGPGQRVESAERLVEQKDTGIERKGARDRDPLPHAPGKFLGTLLRAGVKFTIAICFSMCSRRCPAVHCGKT